MGVYNSLQHAEHNKKVCFALSDMKANYDDWVITTAFYSAIHFLRHKIFPLQFVNNEGNSITVDNFEQYCIRKGEYSKKHSLMRKIIEDNCPADIAAAYNQMLDASWTARYNQYKFSNKISRLSQKRLNAISNYCNK